MKKLPYRRVFNNVKGMRKNWKYNIKQHSNKEK